MSVRWESIAADPSGARAGVLHTRKGDVPTPTFMPVATHATIEALSPPEIGAGGARIALCNTYHLHLRPGEATIEQLGGVARFMGWDGLVLTDSGGFQIFSLAHDCRVTEKGASFRAPNHPGRVEITPESSVAIQQALGSDVMMALDVCVPSTVDEETARAAMERTHRWAARSLEAARAKQTGQAIFGIVQGALDLRLREESAAAIAALPFDGVALGGLAVGEPTAKLHEMLAYAAPLLPTDRPRYVMGIGMPRDLLAAIAAGVDMFDCIIPTLLAQQGYAFVEGGLLRVKREVFRHDERPLEPGCDCPVCLRHTRAYLRHLGAHRSLTGRRMLALHNLHHFQRLVQGARAAILEGRFPAYHAAHREAEARGPLP